METLLTKKRGLNARELKTFFESKGACKSFAIRIKYSAIFFDFALIVLRFFCNFLAIVQRVLWQTCDVALRDLKTQRFFYNCKFCRSLRLTLGLREDLANQTGLNLQDPHSTPTPNVC